MAEHGPNLGMPYTRAFGEGLFEIRAKGREGIGRAFFARSLVAALSFCRALSRKPSRRRPRNYAPPASD